MELNRKNVEKLAVRIFEDRKEMGEAAAIDAAKKINAVIAEKGEANIIFAAAPSQDDLLDSLLKQDIDWSKVRGFHQDEYVGIAEDEPACFGNFLRRAIFDQVAFKELHYLLCDKEDAEKKCEEYAELLEKYPADLIFLGVGENGHLAFNDPAVCDFDDPKMLKIVELDDICRQQQVNDGCFVRIDDVPKRAITMTMSAIMNVAQAICVVPTVRKANAIYHALCGEVTSSCPASILRNHENAVLYLDKDSASKLEADYVLEHG